MSNPPGNPAGSSPVPGETALGSVGHGATSKKVKPKRRKGLVVGITAALALALGGGGALAANSYLGDGTDPVSKLPESTSAFASFNLDVSKEQQRQMLDLVAKFPSSAVDSDVPQEAVSQFLGMLEQHNGDFAGGAFSDWVGPNASVAMWEHDGQSYGLATVSSIDDSQAEEGLAAVREAGGTDQVGYEIKDGYATVAFGEQGAQDAAKSAVAEAEETPLSQSGRFDEAAGFLGDDQVLTAWADLEQSYELIENQAPDGKLGEHIPFDALKGLKDSMKGQVAFGAKAQDFGIEGVSSTFDAPNVVEGKKGMIDKMSQSPEADIAAAAALPDDVKESVMMALLNNVTGIGSGLDGPVLDRVFDALSGADATLSVDDVQGAPSGQATIETNSPDHANALKGLADLAGAVLETSVDGNTITGSTRGYSGDGKITDNEYYEDAVGGAPDKINFAGFFDMEELMPKEAEQALSAFKAVGVTQGTEGGEYVGNYRLIVD